MFFVKNSLMWIFCLFFAMPFCGFSHCLVYVHVGSSPIPAHISDSIAQARLFNPDCPIYLIADPSACIGLEGLDTWQIQMVPIDSLTRSWQHGVFCERVPLPDPLYRLAKERFFCLEEFVRQNDLKDVFHIENDVMIYFDLGEKIDLFRKLYPGMLAAPFHDEYMSVPSFVYVAELAPLTQFIDFMTARAHEITPDMQFLSEFKDAFYKTQCDYLPIIMPKYLDYHPLMTTRGRCPPYSTPFFEHAEEFQMVFDAAAIGQFLDGVNPFYHPPNWQGYLNEASVVNMSFCQIDWQKDNCQRYVPYLICEGASFPIANLHIHSKRLSAFLSTNDSMPPIPIPFDPFTQKR